MLILGINGLWCDRNPVWHTLVPAFKGKFPNSVFCVEEEPWLWPWELGRMRWFLEYILHKQDRDGEILLVGHSLGGVFACTLADRFKQARVQGVITIFSPHTFPAGVFPWLLGTSPHLNVPIVSFGAARDGLVWWGTQHHQACHHENLDCDHFRQLSQSPALADRIAVISKQYLLSPAQSAV